MPRNARCSGSPAGQEPGRCCYMAIAEMCRRAGEEEEQKEEEEETGGAWGVSLMSLPCGAQLNTCCFGKFESCLARLCWGHLTE